MVPLARYLMPSALLVLSGCAALPGDRMAADGAAAAASTSDAAALDARRIGTAMHGERVALAPRTLPGSREIVVGEAYRAASGRRCLHLLRTDGTPLGRIACGSDDSWHIVRSLEDTEERLPLIVPAGTIAE